MLPLLTTTGAAFNPGRLTRYLTGIQGVTSGGVASVQVNTAERVHKIMTNWVALNYTGGTALTATALTGSGTGLKVDVTAVNGQVTAIAQHSGSAGSSFTTADTITFTDATGAGFVGTVTASSGAVTAIAITTAGTATAVNPASILSAAVLKVNGVAMRDITPLQTIMISQANALNPVLGELSFNFSEEWRNLLRRKTANSWDLFGQGTFEIDFTINSGWLQVGVSGIVEYDNLRNLASDGKTPDLEPIAMHQYTFAVSGGNSMTPITTLPRAFPIARVWLLGSSAGNITQLQVLQDTQTVLEASTSQIKARYGAQGFKFGQTDYLNQNQTSQKTLGFNPVNYFDAAVLFDADERFGEALRCKSSFELRVWSTASQTVTVVMELLPGAYQS